jgi:hypothetical protein
MAAVQRRRFARVVTVGTMGLTILVGANAVGAGLGASWAPDETIDEAYGLASTQRYANGSNTLLHSHVTIWVERASSPAAEQSASRPAKLTFAHTR